METGKVVVERIGGKSTVIRCFSKYPLKIIIPNKVGSSQTDAVWIYTITYGGGIVSGDSISCYISVGDSCTAVLTTQSSTKVYKSVGSKCSEQILEATVGRDALLVIIPDPVTCFSTAKYSQMQIFKVFHESSLLIVDWITSGRHERGEKWDFSLYKSTNRIFLEGNEPLFLDTILLEQGSQGSISERLQDYQVIAMIVLWGISLINKNDTDSKEKETDLNSLYSCNKLHGSRPKLKLIQNQIQEDVKKMMSQQFRIPSINSGHFTKAHSDHCSSKPNFIASCSVFGPKGIGIVVRVASMTTESVYKFLQHQLASMEPVLGVSPYF